MYNRLVFVISETKKNIIFVISIFPFFVHTHTKGWRKGFPMLNHNQGSIITKSIIGHGDCFYVFSLSFLYFPLVKVYGLWVLWRHYRSLLRTILRLTFPKKYIYILLFSHTIFLLRFKRIQNINTSYSM